MTNIALNLHLLIGLPGLFMMLTNDLPKTSQLLNDPYMKVMTYNIRYDNPDDGIHAWPQRKEWLSAWIQEQAVDILGIQEGMKHQVEYLDEVLDGFDRYGVGRDDGENAGEFCAIFYRSDRFEALNRGTFWLSETPEVASTGWDAALPRIASWLILKDLKDAQEILVVNTHFDHRGEKARLESARLLLRKIPDLAADRPVILMGDFNSSPSTEAYKVLTNSPNSLADAYDKSLQIAQGAQQTFSGFEVSEQQDGHRIDYVFVSDQIEVVSHTILDNRRKGKYPSDHLPVAAKIRIK